MIEQQLQVFPLAMLEAAVRMGRQVAREASSTHVVTMSGSFGAPDGPGIAAATSDHGVLVCIGPDKATVESAVTVAAQLTNDAQLTNEAAD